MKTELETVGYFPPSIFNSMQVYDWLRGPNFQSGDPPLWCCHGNGFYSTLVHTQRCLEEREQTYTTTDAVWGEEKEQFYSLDLKPMAGYTGLRSCTWTESPTHVFNNSFSMGQGSAASSCDLTLLTCLLIGSYRFCIIPLLAVLSGKDGKLWRSKWDWKLNHKCSSEVFKELWDILIILAQGTLTFCVLDIHSVTLLFTNLILHLILLAMVCYPDGETNICSSNLFTEWLYLITFK